MRKLLVITGDLAAGKSTFADILSKRYGVPAFMKDAVKEVLGDTIGFASRAENLRLSNAAVALQLHLFSRLAATGSSLILEANFHQPEAEKLYHAAAAAGYDMLTLSLYGDDGILHRRYIHRIACENRHPVHCSAPLIEFADFSAALASARSEPLPGRVLRINANDFTYQTDEKLLTQIDTFMRAR